MRTSFIVGIFGLAVAVAATAEWASRRSAGTEIDGTHETSGSIPKDPAMDPADARPAALGDSSGMHGALRDDAEEGPEGATRILVLGDGDAGFRVNAVSLSEAMTDKIDELLTGPDASDLVCGQFVIEGHTDNLGAKEVNQAIGLARALAVRQYLSEQYQIPRDFMRVVSYGADQPVADNATQDGRARNRRVVIKIETHN